MTVGVNDILAISIHSYWDIWWSLHKHKYEGYMLCPVVALWSWNMLYMVLLQSIPPKYTCASPSGRFPIIYT